MYTKNNVWIFKESKLSLKIKISNISLKKYITYKQARLTTFLNLIANFHY